MGPRGSLFCLLPCWPATTGREDAVNTSNPADRLQLGAAASARWLKFACLAINIDRCIALRGVSLGASHTFPNASVRTDVTGAQPAGRSSKATTEATRLTISTQHIGRSRVLMASWGPSAAVVC